MCGLDCGFALGSVKSLGGSCGCVNMVALMPCKFFCVILWDFGGCEALGGGGSGVCTNFIGVLCRIGE